ncbi:MAG TPA: hypothetical protein VFF30_18480 [Nitrososphaerales archaeon]|nr:hypothetical protein [Nitrososphaerales archaeon]
MGDSDVKVTAYSTSSSVLGRSGNPTVRLEGPDVEGVEEEEDEEENDEDNEVRPLLLLLLLLDRVVNDVAEEEEEEVPLLDVGVEVVVVLASVV